MVARRPFSSRPAPRIRAECEPSPPPATSRRCARAARCRPSSRPTTTACTSSSSAAPARAPKALIAELVAGEIARALGLPVPEIVFIELDTDLARTEPDPEIQDLIRASGGLNLGLDYLPGALAFDPLADPPDAELASRIVWFDAFVTNLDRTARNTNMLVWHRKLWLIDHGAALYFHHAGLGDSGARR